MDSQNFSGGGSRRVRTAHRSLTGRDLQRAILRRVTRILGYWAAASALGFLLLGLTRNAGLYAGLGYLLFLYAIGLVGAAVVPLASGVSAYRLARDNEDEFPPMVGAVGFMAGLAGVVAALLPFYFLTVALMR